MPGIHYCVLTMLIIFAGWAYRRKCQEGVQLPAASFQFGINRGLFLCSTVTLLTVDLLTKKKAKCPLLTFSMDRRKISCPMSLYQRYVHVYINFSRQLVCVYWVMVKGHASRKLTSGTSSYSDRRWNLTRLIPDPLKVYFFPIFLFLHTVCTKLQYHFAGKTKTKHLHVARWKQEENTVR